MDNIYIQRNSMINNVSYPIQALSLNNVLTCEAKEFPLMPRHNFEISEARQGWARWVQFGTDSDCLTPSETAGYIKAAKTNMVGARPNMSDIRNLSIDDFSEFFIRY